MVGAYRNFSEQEFVQFIGATSVLRHSEIIHRCDDRRAIYRLWR
jgi:hypothetical protein